MKKAEDAPEDTGEPSILDAVNTDNLPDEVSPQEIAKAAGEVEADEGATATVDDIPSVDPAEAAI